MKIAGAINQAVLGIQRGLYGAQKHASQIASAEQFQSKSPAGLIEPLTGLRMDALQVAASSKVLKAVDDMIGSLFDEKA